MVCLGIPARDPVQLDRPLIMGILNITPDSFSDGGRYTSPEAATEHGLAMARAGADIIDIGGESTRPGSQRVAADEQIRRVGPVIKRLRSALDRTHRQVVLSIDTTSSTVAQVALDGGASIINDISAGRDDPRMFALAAGSSVPVILMHMQGSPHSMQADPRYDDVVAQVESFLLQQARLATAAGVPGGQVILDPGIGFGKTARHNLMLLKHLPRLAGHGYRLVLGASRKRFMGAVCQRPDGRRPGPEELVEATCATTALGVAAGVAIFRVHDVQANRRAADVAWAIVRAG